MPELHGTASWPGAIAIESCQYTVSHGISPGVAILKMQPQPLIPDEQGDLVISDGDNTVTIPACKVESLRVEQGDRGTIWFLTILDRRWRWRELGGINGVFNQLDPHSKYIPWTIRSPFEMAVYCLTQMGETSYTVDMPPGLSSADGARFNTLLPAGIFYPPTGTNPPINWECVPPAVALAQLCEAFGRRVIYQLATDTVLITTIGNGVDDLPPGSVHSQGPSLKAPATPDGVGVQGAPTRYQARFALEAVGEDFDGSFRPIDELTYAPLSAGQKMKLKIVITGGAPTVYGLVINGFGMTFTPGAGETGADALAFFKSIINTSNDPLLVGQFTVTPSGDTLIIEATQPGVSFAYSTTVVGAKPDTAFNTDLIQAPQKQVPDWSLSPPPYFPGIRTTTRLDINQARLLAQKTVWKYYQLVDVGLDSKARTPTKINVPGYGRVPRRQNIVISDTQVDQIVPIASDYTTVNAQNVPVAINLYNGYSRDKPAAVYGAVAKQVFTNAGLFVPDLSLNTDPTSQVRVSFSVDRFWQLVMFHADVWEQKGPARAKPFLILECAVNVREPDTNQLAAYRKIAPLPGQSSQTNPKMRLCPDVQLNVMTTFTVTSLPRQTTILEADPVLRADYYIAGLAAQYQVFGGRTAEYNGIMAIDLDGAIQQITWEVGEQGARTVASRNTEHDIWIAPYAARRRAEMLGAFMENPYEGWRFAGTSNPYEPMQVNRWEPIR